MSAIHSYESIDPIDSLLSPLFVASTLATTGLATISVFDTGFSETIYTLSGTSVTIGWILGAVALLGAFATNQVNYDEWDQRELAIVGGMLVTHIGLAFIPVVKDTVVGSDVLAVPVVALMAAGYYLIAYY